MDCILSWHYFPFTAIWCYWYGYIWLHAVLIAVLLLRIAMTSWCSIKQAQSNWWSRSSPKVFRVPISDLVMLRTRANAWHVWRCSGNGMREWWRPYGSLLLPHQHSLAGLCHLLVLGAHGARHHGNKICDLLSVAIATGTNQLLSLLFGQEIATSKAYVQLTWIDMVSWALGECRVPAQLKQNPWLACAT